MEEKCEKFEKQTKEILGYHWTPQSLDTDEKQVRFYHILNEVFRFAYAKRSALGDEYDSQTDKNYDIEKVGKHLFITSFTPIFSSY